jgi:protein-S-isoprenylcysteine O-methyltransferase Ste14
MNIYGWIIAIFWLLFIGYWIISAMSAKKRVQESPHAREVIFRLLAVVIIVLILQLPIFESVAIYFNTLFTNSIVNILGVILCGMGIAFAIWARLRLGRNWGMPMSIQEKAELITSGPYRFVRHPIYAGMILAMTGSMLVEGFFWLVFLVFVISYFVYSIKVEEALMERQFPETYPIYKRKTKALIPFIF